MGVGCQTRLLLFKPAVELVQVFSQLLIGLSAGAAIYFLKHAFDGSFFICVLCNIKTEVHYNDSSNCHGFCSFGLCFPFAPFLLFDCIILFRCA